MGGLHGSVGGATPGKYLMGLSVIATDSISTVATNPAGDRVRIIPGGNLGFWRYTSSPKSAFLSCPLHPKK